MAQVPVVLTLSSYAVRSFKRAKSVDHSVVTMLVVPSPSRISTDAAPSRPNTSATRTTIPINTTGSTVRERLTPLTDYCTWMVVLQSRVDGKVLCHRQPLCGRGEACGHQLRSFQPLVPDPVSRNSQHTHARMTHQPPADTVTM